MSELLSVEDVALRLQLKPRTIREYIRTGKLSATRIGKQYRLTEAEVQRLAGSAAQVPTAAPPTAAKSVPSTLAVHAESTTVIDIECPSANARTRLAAVLNTVGLGTGTTVHVSEQLETPRLKVIISGPLHATVDTLAAINSVVDFEHD